MSLSVGIDEVHLLKNVRLKNIDIINRAFFKTYGNFLAYCCAGIYNISLHPQPIKVTDDEDNNKSLIEALLPKQVRTATNRSIYSCASIVSDYSIFNFSSLL